jgi:Ribose/Galactose Isomerase
VTGLVIALAADHAGFELKNSMKVVLDEHGVPLVDLGPETADSVDYPDMAGKLAAALKDGRAQQGLLVCGTASALPSRPTAILGSGPPCVTTSPRRVWRASTTTPTFSPLARA